MNPERPIVSVIIPMWNEERAIGSCLASLSRLDFPKDAFEVIVVDNGSTDRCVDIARAFAGISHLTVLEKKGVHVSAVRNVGASRARGEIFAFLDGDCLVSPDWLTRTTALLAQKDIGVVGAHFRIPEDSRWVARAWYGSLQFEKQGDLAWVPGCNTVVSRAAFERAGGFDEAIETNEDCEFCDRVRAAGLRVYGDPASAVVHLGTPQTLGSFYRKIRWHATDGLRVFLRDLPRVSHIKPLLFAFYTLVCAAGILAGAVMAVWERRFGALLAFALALGAPAFLLSLRLCMKRGQWRYLFALVALHLAYGIARAQALVLPRATHTAAPQENH